MSQFSKRNVFYTARITNFITQVIQNMKNFKIVVNYNIIIRYLLLSYLNAVFIEFYVILYVVYKKKILICIDPSRAIQSLQNTYFKNQIVSSILDLANKFPDKVSVTRITKHTHFELNEKAAKKSRYLTPVQNPLLEIAEDVAEKIFNFICKKIKLC